MKLTSRQVCQFAKGVISSKYYIWLFYLALSSHRVLASCKRPFNPSNPLSRNSTLNQSVSQPITSKCRAKSSCIHIFCPPKVGLNYPPIHFTHSAIINTTNTIHHPSFAIDIISQIPNLINQLLQRTQACLISVVGRTLYHTTKRTSVGCLATINCLLGTILLVR
jgi:hypothetical protein